jgi:hypothetical protein
MARELILRFVVGGAVVSGFALVGELWKPKTFCGVFGSAPSVAIVSLALAFAHKGAAYVRDEAPGMMMGAAGMLVYTAACVVAARRRGIPLWLGAAAAWGAWLATSLVLYLVVSASVGY